MTEEQFIQWLKEYIDQIELKENTDNLLIKIIKHKLNQIIISNKSYIEPFNLQTPTDKNQYIGGKRSDQFFH